MNKFQRGVSSVKENEYAEDSKTVIWESCGYSSFFGIPVVTHHYTLFHDSISIRCGIPVSRTTHIKLHDIVMMQALTSPFGQLFHCGKIELVPRGWNTKKLEMWVKKPEEVLQLIADTQSRSKQQYQLNRKRYKRDRKKYVSNE